MRLAMIVACIAAAACAADDAPAATAATDFRRLITNARRPLPRRRAKLVPLVAVSPAGSYNPAAAALALYRATSRALLIDDRVRGRDQRALWLRAVAAVHPSVRLGVVLLSLAVLAALWLRPGWSAAQCVPIAFGPWLGSACRSALALALVVGGVALAVVGLAVQVYRGMAEEDKDRALSEELLAAAASSAAYEERPAARLAELRNRGVDSANWRVDDELSSPTCAVFANPHEQRVIVAYRGTATLDDWGSNLRRIVPGDEERSFSFQRGLATARRVQAKYVLWPSVLITGHSRGGTMADFVGGRSARHTPMNGCHADCTRMTAAEPISHGAHRDPGAHPVRGAPPRSLAHCARALCRWGASSGCRRRASTQRRGARRSSRRSPPRCRSPCAPATSSRASRRSCPATGA